MVSLENVWPSNNPWTSPLHMVAKNNRGWRLCEDCRSLNQITVPDRYSLSHIRDFSLHLNGKIFFPLEILFELTTKHQCPQQTQRKQPPSTCDCPLVFLILTIYGPSIPWFRDDGSTFLGHHLDTHDIYSLPQKTQSIIDYLFPNQ